jgi:hypothetical protein
MTSEPELDGGDAQQATFGTWWIRAQRAPKGSTQRVDGHLARGDLAITRAKVMQWILPTSVGPVSSAHRRVLCDVGGCRRPIVVFDVSAPREAQGLGSWR